MTDDLAQVCVVWYNADRKTNPQSRYLQALSTDSKPITPLSFDVVALSGLDAFKNAIFVASEVDLFKNLPISSRKVPLIMPIQVARQLLGWQNFVPSTAPENLEKGL
jgi:hypothetical protein